MLAKGYLNPGQRGAFKELRFAKLPSLKECTSFGVQTLVLAVTYHTP